MERYVLIDSDGRYIAVDSASGYPYPVENIWQARLWPSRDKAEVYNAVMSWKDYDNPVYRLAIVTTEVNQVAVTKGDDLKALRG